MTKSRFEMAFGVNHVGHFLFTTGLLDRIVDSGPSRIVNVPSGNHFNAKGIDFDAVRRSTKTFIGLKEYDVSKLANVLFTKSLVERLEPHKVTVFSVNPGPVATDIWRRMPGPMYALYRRIARLRASKTEPSRVCTRPLPQASRPSTGRTSTRTVGPRR